MNNFIKITRIEYKAEFEKALFKTFFHEPEWHEFLEKEFKWLKFEYYKYKNEAILPIARFKVQGKEKLVSLPFCEYGGALPLKENINFGQLERNCLQFENIKIKIHPLVLSKDAVSVVKGTGIATHILDLIGKNQEELWQLLRKTLRHSIGHAKEKGIEIKKCSNLDELERFYNIYVSTLKRKMTVPYPFKVLKYLFEKNAEILLAHYKGKIIAGDLFLKYNKITHYFISASEFKYRKLEAGALLLWSAIKNAIESENELFDLGASPKNSNLEIFKRGWGGQEYPIMQIGIKRSEESLRSSNLRKLWKLLPNFLVKKLSYSLIKYRL